MEITFFLHQSVEDQEKVLAGIPAGTVIMWHQGNPATWTSDAVVVCPNDHSRKSGGWVESAPHYDGLSGWGNPICSKVWEGGECRHEGRGIHPARIETFLAEDLPFMREEKVRNLWYYTGRPCQCGHARGEHNSPPHTNRKCRGAACACQAFADLPENKKKVNEILEEITRKR